MAYASEYRARRVSVNASPAAIAASRCQPLKPGWRDLTERPEQLSAIERPISTPKTSPRSWTSALRRVRDARLEMLARELSHPDRQRHPGRKVTVPRVSRDPVRR